MTDNSSFYDIRFSTASTGHYYELRLAEGNQMKRIKRVYLPEGIEFAAFTFNDTTMSFTPKGTSANPGTCNGT
ncbi:hypothetical protein N752_13230 [Desulforamulus aquiferis]|nr:hypothetical protein [Desulforamulus aquiferis]RYD04330.1 hypothetical protein N752_13230 [Desulforamulus aquiferis]